MVNSIELLYMQNIFRIHIHEHDKLYEKIYHELLGKRPENRPHISSLVTNVSLVLINSNVVVHNSRASVPNMINVGGLHIKTDAKLPEVQNGKYSIYCIHRIALTKHFFIIFRIYKQF